MHWDGQQIGAMAIVAGAGVSVGRRVWKQIAAFRTPPGKPGGGGGCDGCAGSRGKAAPPALVQIQMRPPAHLRRPANK